MKIIDKIFELTEPVVTGLGYELYEVEYAKENGDWVLTLYIDALDGENAITLDDCEKVSRAVEPVIDEANPIEDHYYLSISSLGLDRPLKNEKDFKRNIGKKVDVKLYAPLNGEKQFVGDLVSFTADDITVKTAKGERTIPRKQTALVRLHIDF